jgi:Tfp pilus assembly protein PilN
MRSVNLIPPEEQRGDRAPMRTGVFTYVLIGGLSVLLLLVVAVALTSKQITDRKSQKADLQQELTQQQARAQSLAAFVNFANVTENRANTLTGLAQSRFDWSRVLHELSLVIPANVKVNTLTGTVSPDVQLDSSDGGSGSTLRADIAGPALEITGCTTSQPAVAAFVASLEDVDGVTRVGLESSGRGNDQEGGATAATPAPGTTTGSTPQEGAGCPAWHNGIIASQPYQFSLVVAFDSVTTPAAATAPPAAPPSTGGTQGGQDKQVSDKSQAQQSAEVASVKTKAHTAVHKLIPGG